MIKPEFRATNLILLSIFALVALVGLLVVIVRYLPETPTTYEGSIKMFDYGEEAYNKSGNDSSNRSMWLWIGSELAMHFEKNLGNSEVNPDEVMSRLERIRDKISWKGLDDRDYARWWRINNVVYNEHARQSQLKVIEGKNCSLQSAISFSLDGEFSPAQSDLSCQ